MFQTGFYFNEQETTGGVQRKKRRDGEATHFSNNKRKLGTIDSNRDDKLGTLDNASAEHHAYQDATEGVRKGQKAGGYSEMDVRKKDQSSLVEQAAIAARTRFTTKSSMDTIETSKQTPRLNNLKHQKVSTAVAKITQQKVGLIEVRRQALGDGRGDKIMADQRNKKTSALIMNEHSSVKDKNQKHFGRTKASMAATSIASQNQSLSPLSKWNGKTNGGLMNNQSSATKLISSPRANSIKLKPAGGGGVKKA